jgi:hypothetical protein
MLLSVALFHSGKRRDSHTRENVNAQVKHLGIHRWRYLPLTRTRRKPLTCSFATPQPSPTLRAPRNRVRSVRGASDLRNRLKDVPVTWPFRNRLVPERDEVRRG